MSCARPNQSAVVASSGSRPPCSGRSQALSSSWSSSSWNTGSRLVKGGRTGRGDGESEGRARELASRMRGAGRKARDAEAQQRKAVSARTCGRRDHAMEEQEDEQLLQVGAVDDGAHERDRLDNSRALASEGRFPCMFAGCFYLSILC
jgi:hypothetical protein